MKDTSIGGGLLRALGLSSTVYGTQGTPYLTRYFLTPMTPWGQLRVHVFHRPDEDPDPHDHPWDFVTFPLTSYVELFMDGTGHFMRERLVKRFRFHYRSAEMAHLVTGRVSGKVVVNWGKIYTIVWSGRIRRTWGFWQLGRPANKRQWVDWKTYLNVTPGSPRPFRHWLRWDKWWPYAVCLALIAEIPLWVWIRG